jgi:transcriptional regulator with XRE-family HTH domain
VHKQDTAVLNAEALSLRIGELGFKQYWVAERIGVDKLTVNRWLNGKVKRISRDNLSRLARLLECPEDKLICEDELDLCATRAEQSHASRLLLDPGSRQMFLRSEEFALYESLLKAVMHPNMQLKELCGIYSQLTILAARQNNLASAKRYAGIALDYASRIGDSALEFSARSNIIAAEGDAGQLMKARRELEELVSFAESVGNLRGRAVAQINLLHAYRLQGELRKSLATAKEALSFFTLHVEPGAFLQACVNTGSTLLDGGAFELALRYRQKGCEVAGVGDWPRLRATGEVFAAAVESLLGRRDAALRRLTAVLPEFIKLGRVQEGEVILPALVLRRAGSLVEARRYLDESQGRGALSPYDEPFVLEEQGRIAAAAGSPGEAQELRGRANAGYAARNMTRRQHADPCQEPGATMKLTRGDLTWFEEFCGQAVPMPV